MNPIIPVNNHLLIQPLKHESLLPTEKGQYEEIGTIIAIAGDVHDSYGIKFNDSKIEPKIRIGDKVFYDSWQSAKYPTGKDDEVIWLVPYSHVRAIQKKDVEN